MNYSGCNLYLQLATSSPYHFYYRNVLPEEAPNIYGFDPYYLLWSSKKSCPSDVSLGKMYYDFPTSLFLHLLHSLKCLNTKDSMHFKNCAVLTYVDTSRNLRTGSVSACF